MTTSDSHPVVAGVDGSADGRAAVDFAAWEASRRHLPLRLVHGLVPPAVALWFDYPVPVSDDEDPSLQAQAILDETARQVREHHPDLAVSTALSEGSAAGVLVDESRRASLVVVGTRGLGGFTGLVVGSASTQVAAHGYSPVIVVRPPATGSDTDAPVVVGLDGSTESTAALEFAFDAASSRGVPLVAVYVWQALPAGNLGPIDRWHYDRAEAEAEARRLLAEQLAGWQEKYPEVVVDRQAVYGFNPAQTLIDASTQAGLLVVGCRGRGGFVGLLLGSVSRALVHHSNCSVAVVHAHTVYDGQS